MGIGGEQSQQKTIRILTRAMGSRIRVDELSNADLRPYRLPFLHRISQSKSVQVSIWHGQPARGLGAPSARPQGVPVTEKDVKNLFWPGGRHRVLWQRGVLGVLSSDSEVLVCPEVIHNVGVWLIALTHRLFGKRLVLKGYFYRPTRGRFSRASFFLRRLLHRRAATFLAYTDRGARSLLAEGISEDRVFVSQNSLDTEMLMTLATEVDPGFGVKAREELGLGDGPVLLFLGKLIEVKRVDIAVDVVSQLNRSTSLLVVGEGKARRQLEERALGLPVRFLGAIYDERELASYFSMTDLLVLPGRVGLTCVHGFANGVPCVTTHEALVEQSPEYDYIQDGYNGVVVSSTDPSEHATAIRELLSDRERLASLSEGAVKTAEALGVSRMVEQYEKAVLRAVSD